MNPDNNRFERLAEYMQAEVRAQTLATQVDVSGPEVRLVRPNGQPVPETWTKFQVGEVVTIKNYAFKVAYIGETAILFEPVGPVLVGQEGT